MKSTYLVSVIACGYWVDGLFDKLYNNVNYVISGINVI